MRKLPSLPLPHLISQLQMQKCLIMIQLHTHDFFHGGRAKENAAIEKFPLTSIDRSILSLWLPSYRRLGHNRQRRFRLHIPE